MDRRLWALLALVFVGYVVWNMLAGSPSASISASVSPDTASPGSSVTLSGSVSSWSWSSPGLYCVDFSQIETASWCNSSSGKCYVPCQHPDASTSGVQVYKCADASGSSGCTLALYSGAEPEISADSDPTYVGAVDYLLAEDSSPSSYTGFLLPLGTRVKVSFTVRSYSSFEYLKPTVALCYSGSVSYVPPSGWSWYDTISGYWYGRNWTCQVYTKTDPVTSSSSYWYVTASSSNVRFYVSFATQCWYDSSECPSSVMNAYVHVDSVIPVYMGRGVVFWTYDPDGVLSCPYDGLTSDSDDTTSSSVSQTCTVKSTASAGGHYVGYEVWDYIPWYYHSFDDQSGVLRDKGHYIGVATDTLTVATPATGVYLYDYGSNAGYPEQEPDDHYVEFRVKVTGGTVFDYVKIYIDGTLKATYYKSDMTCGSSYCYKDSRISLSGYSDGSHTIKAELYVGGSLKDSDQKTFNYYQVGVRNVSASQVGTENRFTVSWEMKGGWKQYRVYIDDSSCVAQDWTGTGPSDAHDWQSFGPYTYDIPSCAATSGTHTVYVEARDESGLTASDSATVTWTIYHSYDVSLTQPVSGVVHLQTDREGLPPSTYTETMSATYSTDDPSASLVFKVNGSQVQSWTVTGSGSQSYSVSADDLSCGSVTFTAELGPAGDPASGDTDESTVVYYCWYLDIRQPADGSEVTFPSEDLSTIAPGSYLDVYVVDSVYPSDRTYAVYAQLDGVDGAPITCPAGYDHCFRFDVSGMSCGSTHTVSAWIDEAGDTRATASSSVTFQCSQRFVRIDSPSDGQELDYYVPIGDVNVVLAVTYAGGDSVRVIVNGQEVFPSETNDCSSTVCYVLTTAEGLQLGPNDVNVVLYDSGSPVAQDSVRFYVYTWIYVPGEDWDVTPPILVLRENGSQAESCTVSVDGNTYYMSYDSAQSWWYYPIDESWKDKNVTFTCQFHSRVVWEGNYTVQGSTVSQPGAPVGGGVGRVTQPVSKPAFPIFPDKVQVSHYIYSVYHFAGRSPTDVFRDVYVSQDKLCFVPKEGKHSITYYAYNFGAWPTGENEVRQILSKLSQEHVRSVDVIRSGNAYCVPLSGTAVIRDLVSGSVNGEYYFLVLDTAQAVAPINVTFLVIVVLVAALLLWMLGGGKFV